MGLQLVMVWWGTLGAATVQPLPPNTGMSLVADVAGTVYANDAYWAEACERIPSTATGIVVDMGAVRCYVYCWNV